jgi:hypothetical protein
MNASTAKRGAANWSGWQQPIFTIPRSRRALRYVSLVVQDACDAFHTAQRCRLALLESPPPRDAARLACQRDQALRRLNAAADECNAVGADLLDISRGLVRFAAEIEGRSVSLLWRLGQSTTEAWRDLEGEAVPNGLLLASS